MGKAASWYAILVNFRSRLSQTIYCDIRCSIRRRWWVLTKLCRNSQDTTSISASLAESCRVDSLSGGRICGLQFNSSAGFISAYEAPNTSWGGRLLRNIGKEQPVRPRWRTQIAWGLMSRCRSERHRQTFARGRISNGHTNVPTGWIVVPEHVPTGCQPERRTAHSPGGRCGGWNRSTVC
jgi:hypothetical protein